MFDTYWLLPSQADLLSREYLRTHWQTEDKPPKQKQKQRNKKRPTREQRSQQQEVYHKKQTTVSSDDESSLDLGIDLWDDDIWNQPCA